MENTQVGPFLIIKRLGRNRRQKVYHARQVDQEKDVALKFISLPPTIERKRAIDKINLEVEVLKRLQHPNLIQLYGAGVADEKIFLAHELVPGESLSVMLSRRGRLAPDLAVDIARQVAEVLQFLHQQDAMHAKLNPDKIIINQSHRVKIADLRLNRSRRKRWDDAKRRELDIAAYMAPEQFAEGATHKSDIYSLGVILYEMLTGRLPYEPDTMGRMNRRKMQTEAPSVAAHIMNCPIWLDRTVCQMLDPSPRKRPHSAQAVGLALEEIKKIDANKKAAVSQITGNFNPLTAGSDKSEANRLLGKKKKSVPDDDRAFYEKTPFLVGCLLLILAISFYALLPISSAKLYKQAEVMMQSDDSSQWRSARTELRKIIERGTDDPYHTPATDLFYESRRRTLVEQAESGRPMWTQTDNTLRIVKAIQLQNDGRQDRAKQEYEILVTTVDPEGEERHIYLEARRRLSEIQDAKKLPFGVNRLNELIEQLTLANSATEIKNSKNRLNEIISTYSNQKTYQSVIALAETALALLDEKSSDISQEPSDAPSENATEDDASGNK